MKIPIKRIFLLTLLFAAIASAQQYDDIGACNFLIGQARQIYNSRTAANFDSPAVQYRQAQKGIELAERATPELMRFTKEFYAYLDSNENREDLIKMRTAFRVQKIGGRDLTGNAGNLYREKMVKFLEKYNEGKKVQIEYRVGTSAAPEGIYYVEGTERSYPIDFSKGEVVNGRLPDQATIDKQLYIVRPPSEAEYIKQHVSEKLNCKFDDELEPTRAKEKGPVPSRSK